MQMAYKIEGTAMNTRRLTELALMTAVALIIFSIELQLPPLLPIPGMKLGLANIVTVYGVYRYHAGEVAAVLFCRIVLGTFFAGQIVALLYSLAGGALCLLGMLGLKRILPPENIWMCSVLGAVLHNIGQILMAILLTKTPALALYLPPLLLTGCTAGLFTGLCAQHLIRRGF